MALTRFLNRKLQHRNGRLERWTIAWKLTLKLTLQAKGMYEISKSPRVCKISKSRGMWSLLVQKSLWSMRPWTTYYILYIYIFFTLFNKTNIHTYIVEYFWIIWRNHWIYFLYNTLAYHCISLLASQIWDTALLRFLSSPFSLHLLMIWEILSSMKFYASRQFLTGLTYRDEQPFTIRVIKVHFSCLLSALCPKVLSLECQRFWVVVFFGMRKLNLFVLSPYHK